MPSIRGCIADQYSGIIDEGSDEFIEGATFSLRDVRVPSLKGSRKQVSWPGKFDFKFMEDFRLKGKIADKQNE